MRLPPAGFDASLDFNSWISTFLEWLASETTYQPAMEAAVRQALGEGEAGREAPKSRQGCTSSRWLKGPGLWLSTTPSPSNKTVFRLTDPSSSLAKTISYENMPKE